MQIRKWWRIVCETYYVGDNYGGRAYGVYCILYSFFYPLWLRSLMCKMFGHHIEASAIGLEDSGGEDLWCNRCGWSERVWHS